MRNLFKKKGQKGFTLVELLLVVAIIGILAAVAIPRFNPNTADAKRAKVRSTLENLETAAELYRIKNSVYPGDIGAMVSDGQLKRAPVSPEFGGTYDIDETTGVATWTSGGTPYEADDNIPDTAFTD